MHDTLDSEIFFLVAYVKFERRVLYKMSFKFRNLHYTLTSNGSIIRKENCKHYKHVKSVFHILLDNDAWVMKL